MTSCFFYNGFTLYGASELIDMQAGYSYNAFTKEEANDWPKNYIVIADHGADPFVLDLSRSDGEDAPVLFAFHGEGEWDFTEVFSSFSKFLKLIQCIKETVSQ